MDHPLQIDRTVADLVEATVVGMQATGVWDRTVAANRRLLVAALLTLGVAGTQLLHDLLFAVTMAAVSGVAVWMMPRLLLHSAHRRLPRQFGDQVQSSIGPRALGITDEGLSEAGSGITTTVAWNRLTHHVVTPSRHVFAAGMAAIIDVPRRGDITAVDQFAANADAKMAAARTPLPT